MRILLVGYGKMGQAIEKIAIDRGHQIAGKISIDNEADLHSFSSDNCDVAIEFTQPSSGFNNITSCIKKGIPVVSGTTGWLDKWDNVDTLVEEKKGAFFYASNYSIGVNIFFKLNQYLAKMMNQFPDYDIQTDETHHTHKLDAPSGTAITLAEGIDKEINRVVGWHLSTENKKESIPITAIRKGEVPGTHSIEYNSEIDSITIQHEAHSRQGFASGAVVAAEWLVGKQGMFGMDDMLKL